jgi:hypothetical protein
VTSLPLEKKARWYATELATTLFASVPTLLTAIGGIVKGAHDGERGVLGFGAGVLVALIVGTTFRALSSRRKDAREAAKKSLRDLEGCLYVLHSAILAMRGLAYTDTAIAKLRVTIFRVLEHDDRVLQIVSFVGSCGGGEGTILSSRSGIVGRAILRGTTAAMIRDGSFDDYVQTLVDGYAMRAHEARILPDDRFAFLAVPLLRHGTSDVVGVVYMDSPDPAFLSDPARPRNDVANSFLLKVATACAGLSSYTELRYPTETSTR